MSEASSERARALNGYVADSLYPSNFHPYFQPPWTQAMFAFHGLASPTSARAPFDFVDLGCGDGVGLIVTAAAHPEGRFVGIDAMRGHVERGNALIAELGLDNVELRHATFEEGLAVLPAGSADYVMAQGVFSWVSPQNRSALMALAAHVLRPGGVFSVGYNTLPGWGGIAPFQRLVWALADGLPGAPAERFEMACERARASGLIEPSVFERLDARRAKLPRDYFAHEYLNEHWQPLWSADVAAAMAVHGLQYAADVQPLCLREDFALKRAWRDQLDTITDPMRRAVAIDICVERWYRVDVFTKRLFDGHRAAGLEPSETRAARLTGYWATNTTPDGKQYELRTPAGRLRFDNAAARAIVTTLQDGPLPLSAVQGIAEVDLLNTIDALWMADFVRPVAPPIEAPRGAALNRRLLAAAQGETPMNGLVGHYGGVAVPRAVLASGISASARRRLGIVEPSA